MKSIKEIKLSLDAWINKKLKEVEEQEQEFKVFEIPLDSIRNPKPDWSNVYKKTPVTFDELISFDIDKKTGMLKPPTPPNKCI